MVDTVVLVEAEHGEVIPQVSLGAQVQAHQERILRWLNLALVLGVLALLLALSLWALKDGRITLGEHTPQWRHIAQLALGTVCTAFAIAWLVHTRLSATLSDYEQAMGELEQALGMQDRLLVQQAIKAVQADAARNALIRAGMAQHEAALIDHLTYLAKAELQEKIEAGFAAILLDSDKRLAQIKSRVPLIKIQNQVRASLAVLETRREEISQSWKEAYEKFSWWNKLCYAGTNPNFTEMDKIIRELSSMNTALTDKHQADLQTLDNHFQDLRNKAFTRLSAARKSAEDFVAHSASLHDVDLKPLRMAMWFSALSLPISVWSDVNRSGDVYEVLRQVNGNFARLSDDEIWLETLFLSSEGYAGLAALTKGAYFERLVEADTGGTLHEHFNNPDTDIVIDGVAFQLKATDSASYVNGVSDEIPVIATSEVASQTGVIDSGFSNDELTGAVELALGGTIVDFGDSAVDAVLSGLGGLGLFATLEGVNHAVKKHENGGDGVEAMFEGVGVAIKGTARAFVGTAELGWKVISSRPSRFLGRALLRGVERIDAKMMSQQDAGRATTLTKR